MGAFLRITRRDPVSGRTGCDPGLLSRTRGRSEPSKGRWRGSQAVAAGESREREDAHGSTDVGVSFNTFSRAQVLRGKGFRGGSRIVPLLDPLCVGGCSAGVPFVTEIELHGEGPASAAPGSQDVDVFELRFVLHGRGILRYNTGVEVGEGGRETMVETGDAILMRHGVARLEGVGVHDDDVCSMATFVTYMPRKLLERDPPHSLNPLEFAAFGGQYLWDDGSEALHRLSDVMEKKVLDGLLSGATLWAERSGQTAVRSVDLTSDAVPSTDTSGETEGSNVEDVFESAGDVDSSLVTPYCTIANEVDVNDVYHKHITTSTTYELPNQTNRLALLFDPFADTVPFVFGVEIFEPGHRTTPHIHESAFEVFFILSGEGEGFCDGERFEVTAGDVVAFHPGSEHGIDNGTGSRMYCVEMMMPDEEFAQFVRAGKLDGLRREELCILRRIGCQ